MAKQPVIEMVQVIKKYPAGGEETTVLKGIDLQIYSGEYIIFFGASGSGKSTILNTICGLEPPTSGKVVIRGDDISQFSKKELAKYRRSKIGIVFQQFNLIRTFKVWENATFPLAADGIPRSRRKERALMLLKLVGLANFADRKPTELSGGQQQRVAIARALSSNPWIIIADEPTGNLDSRSADDVMTILRVLNKKSRRTVIMVTHNPDYLKEADRVFRVKDGSILKIDVNRRSDHEEDEDEGPGSFSELQELSFADKDKKEDK